jgi:hypothetical protein
VTRRAAIFSENANEEIMRKIICTFILIVISFNSIAQINGDGDLNHYYASENVQFSTLRIEVYLHSLKTTKQIDTASGTSFLFSFKVDSLQDLPLLITNKHVIKDAFAFSIYLTEKDKDGNPLFGKIDTLTCFSKDIAWIPHPNPSIDLCATPFIPILKKYSKNKFGYFYKSIMDSDIPTENVLADLKGIEEIFMIGYPIGIWDCRNNLPIIRKGVTATHPLFNYQNNPIFLIDAACFPGSSGSPIFIINEGTYTTKTSTRMGRRTIFLGVLFAGPTFNPDGSIKVIDIPTKKEILFIQNIPINLGYVIKSNQLLQFKKIFGL